MSVREHARAIQQYLGLDRDIVGVKIACSEIPRGYVRPPEPVGFCKAVISASDGGKIAITSDVLLCQNSVVTLGFEEPQFIDLEPRIRSAETKLILLSRLEDWNLDTNPDVIIFIGNAKHGMELLDLINGFEGKIFSEVAVCGFLTAYPFVNRKASITFFCKGARSHAKLMDSEIGIGVPFGMVEKIIERIRIKNKLKK